METGEIRVNKMTKEQELRKQLGFEEEIFYHYCSLEALYGIITSKSFWLTSLNSTNDSKELKVGQTILDNALQELIIKEEDLQYKKLLEKIANAPRDVEYKKLRKNKNRHYYGASFVNNRDSLTHWERYGNNGFGVCIAFNIWMLQNYFMYKSLPDICRTWLWHDKVIYNGQQQKEHIKTIIRSKINGMIKGARTYNYEVNMDKMLTIPNMCNVLYYTTLAQVRPTFKHLGFSDEHEYRLVFEEGEAEENAQYLCKIASRGENENGFLDLSERIKIVIDELGLAQEKRKHTMLGKSIRSYYALNLEPIWGGDALIPEIILGPRCYQNKRELEVFIKCNSLFGTKVRTSVIPIR
ncbi:DUF2971 domain-containing protein [Sporomusa sphaeroides]|uniref:DUF2971 domain-containing protein n=1 Tax=Sporomusa sphaeroides TaxID=47679 RepID=UPI002B6D1AEC|nr:DUF2971 domain-containing protein [Sporomusa sphaeroides]HML35730.1 DUF2971 domain-containing protein [Sporomusa sphaeroides]